MICLGAFQGLVGIFIYYLVCLHGLNAEINQVSDPSLYQNTYIAFSVCFVVLRNCGVTFCLDVSRGKRIFTKDTDSSDISIWIILQSPQTINIAGQGCITVQFLQ